MDSRQLESAFYFMDGLRKWLLMGSLHTNAHICLALYWLTAVSIASSPKVHSQIFSAARFPDNSYSRGNASWHSYTYSIFILIVRNSLQVTNHNLTCLVMDFKDLCENSLSWLCIWSCSFGAENRRRTKLVIFYRILSKTLEPWIY